MKNDEDVTWARVEFGLNFQLVNPLVLRAKNAQNGQNRTGRNPGLRVYSKFQFKSVFSVQGVRGLSGNPTMMIGGGHLVSVEQSGDNEAELKVSDSMYLSTN